MRLPGIPEEVERVDSFDELRAGMIVWVVGCEICAGYPAHRGVLILAGEGEVFDAVDDICAPRSYWEFAPETICGATVIDAQEVQAGQVHRVVDPAMDAENATVARVTKPHKAVRA